nr:hypothetical protein [uncultured Flavobacterium sp.]
MFSNFFYVMCFVLFVKLLDNFFRKAEKKKASLPSEEVPIQASNYTDNNVATPQPKTKNSFLYPEGEFLRHKEVKKYKPKNYDV